MKYSLFYAGGAACLMFAGDAAAQITDWPTYSPTYYPSQGDVGMTEVATDPPTDPPTDSPTYYPSYVPTSAPMGDVLLADIETPTYAPSYVPTYAPTVAAGVNSVPAPDAPSLPEVDMVMSMDVDAPARRGLAGRGRRRREGYAFGRGSPRAAILQRSEEEEEEEYDEYEDFDEYEEYGVPDEYRGE